MAKAESGDLSYKLEHGREGDMIWERTVSIPSRVAMKGSAGLSGEVSRFTA